jgi:pimeloyl-ACP methyl ester carboxylesterase
VRVAELNGARIAYDVRGDGPPVVLVHAGIADRRMWRDTVPALEREFTVVTYDQRGYGDSTLPGGPATYTDDLGALLAELGIEGVSLVGVSLGGRVVLEHTLLHPESVTRLVLVGAGLPDWNWSDEVQRVGDDEDEALEAGNLDLAVAVNVDLWVGDASPEVRELVATMQRRAFEIPTPDPEPTAPPPLDPPASARLADIAVPTLVVVGERDVDDIRRIADVLTDGIPDARQEVVAGAAHLPPLERPDEFNALLLDFLRAD